MNESRSTTSHKETWIIWLLTLAAVPSVMIVKPVFNGLVYGFILGYITLPLVERIESKIGGRRILSLLPVLLIIPLTIVVYHSTISFVRSMISFLNSEQFIDFVNWLEHFLNRVMVTIGVSAQVSIKEPIQSFVESISVESLLFFAGKIFQLTIELILAATVSYYTVLEGRTVFEKLGVIFTSKANTLYSKFAAELKRNIDGFIFGYILTAGFQGAAASILFLAEGLDFWMTAGFLTFIVSVLPVLGAPVVFTPIAVYQIVNGYVLEAATTILYGIIVLTIIPTFIIYPKLTSRRGEIHPLIVLIGVIGGATAFGAAGIFVGPLILSVLSTIVRMIPEMLKR